MGWLDTALGWAGDLLGDTVSDVGNWFDGTDFGDWDGDAFTDLGPWASGRDANFNGLLSGASKWDGWGNLLKTGARTWQERDLAKQRLGQYAPLNELASQYDTFSRGFYNPQNLGKLENQEIARMTEQAAPLLDRATYRGAAAGAKAGQPWGASTVGNYNQEQNQRRAAGLFSDVIQPRARQNVRDTGEMMGNTYANRLSMMQGQPQFMTNKQTGAFGLSPEYQNLMFQTGSPWKPLLSSYLKG
jgi:hypothetical protein